MNITDKLTKDAIIQFVLDERERQDEIWGVEFDKKNTPNDWISYITRYTGKAVTGPGFDVHEFRKNLIIVAALCFAALEQDAYAARHYDM